jgi:peptidoglycan hydrolase-like protein with peptidoglycan-binding domain
MAVVAMSSSAAVDAPRGFAGLMSMVTVIPDEDTSSAKTPATEAYGPPENGGHAAPSDALEPSEWELDGRVKQGTPPTTRPKSGSSSAGFWIAAAVVILFLIIVSNLNSGRVSQVGAPNNANGRVETGSPTGVPEVAMPSPTPRIVPSTNLDTSEIMPPVGTEREFVRGNIRYCEFVHQRLEIARALVTEWTSDDFNRAVEDWNSRCSSYRYLQPDRDAITAELDGRQAQFQVEARAMVDGWGPPPAPATPNSPYPQFQPVYTTPSPTGSPVSPTQPVVSVSATPSPTTTPMAELPPPMDLTAKAPAPQQRVFEGGLSSLDLLKIDDVTKIQKRLAALGFFKGPANGTWGPASRLALRAFKVANGLPNDDRVDDIANSRLMSPAAVAAIVGEEAPPASSAPDTIYPPPQGASLNPLNAADAINIHARLRALGFYRGKNETLWSGASRAALKVFKSKTGLPADDRWDAETEKALFQN